MNQLPEFWRDEVWHPLTVHLPLVTLILSTIFIAVSFFGKQNKAFWYGTGAVLLLIGTIGSWIAVYTGNMADSVVAREVCDPTVLEDHENSAYLVSWIFSGASVTVIFRYFFNVEKYHRIIKPVLLVLMLAGSGFLVYLGHLGSTLVYQQAAGVYVPSEDCDEFSD